MRSPGNRRLGGRRVSANGQDARRVARAGALSSARDSPVTGVYETVVYASDVVAAARFYSDVLDLRLLEEPDELSAAFRLDDGSVFLVFDPVRASAAGRRVPVHGAVGAGHVAFAVEMGGLEAWTAELRRRGIDIEREIAWEEGGRSVYVRDPSGNSVELVEGEAWPAGVQDATV